MKRSYVLACSLALLCAPGCGKKDEGKTEARSKSPADKNVLAAPGTPAAPDSNQILIERGKYVAGVSGCSLCHTPMGERGPDMSKELAGGLEMKEAFGTWRSPNITMHPDTGIGKWTDEQIIAAIRTGMRPDGSGLYPIMPFMFYNVMSDDDAKALVAYLRSVPAVDNNVERVTLKMPTADKMSVPKPEGKPPGESPVAKGAYLVSLSHCGACHVPLDEKTKGPDFSRMFQGGMPFEMIEPFGKGVVFAPNITPDEKTGIGSWSEGEIVNALRLMTKKDGKPIVFPMALYAPVFAAMSDDDTKAIAAFLKSLPPAENKVPNSKYELSAPPPGASAKPPRE